MMPFSVLRTCLGGVFSWVILGAAVYFLWEWADGIDPLTVIRHQRDPRTGEVVAIHQPQDNPDRQGGWPFLATGLGLLALSLGGSLPVVLLISRPGGVGSAPKTTRKATFLERPDGSRLHVQEFGVSEAPTLLLTHGWSLESGVWNEVATRLHDRCRIIVWDLPGLGQSQAPRNGDYRLEKMADDLAAVVDFAGKGPLVLVGHSIGGMIVQTFCRRHSERLGSDVSGIVLLHTTYTNPLHTALGSSLWRALQEPILRPLNHLTIWLAPLAWLSNWQSYLNGNLHLMTRFSSFTGQQTWGQLNYAAWLAAKAWPAVIARGNLAMVEFDEQETLPAIDIPALVIAGRHDRMTKPEASERLAELLGNSVESAVESGHLGFFERPAEIAELLAEFAERCASDRSAGRAASKRPKAEARRAGRS